MFALINYTQTYWPTKNRDVIVGVKVPTADFIEYIMAISDLYNGEIPEKVVYEAPTHIKGHVDLSPLSEEFLKVMLNSEYLYYGPSKELLIDIMRSKGVDPQVLSRL